MPTLNEKALKASEMVDKIKSLKLLNFLKSLLNLDIFNRFETKTLVESSVHKSSKA